ncbi:hypothetical protein SPURM210S_08511 [Streptomyces purpurascens]
MPLDEQAQAHGQGEQHPVVPLHGDPLPQQGEHTVRWAEEPHERTRSRPANLGIRVPREPDEDIGTRVQGGERSRGDVLRGTLVTCDVTDADEEFHDPCPVPHLLADGEREEKRNTGERRVVHASLVVHGAVHPVERALPLDRVGGGQSPQESGHVLRAAVRMPQRGPVDLVDPPEHVVLPRRSTN